MFKSSKTIAIALAGFLTVSSASIAQAYPSGTNPSVGLTSYSRLTPGDSVSVSVSRIYRGCSVSIGWNGSTQATAVAGKTSRTAPVSVASPTVGGVHTLTARFGDGCRTDAGKSISKTITVGKLVRHSVGIKTTSSSARRNPTLALTGKIFLGAEAQTGLRVNLRLTKPNGDVQNLVATTGANGTYTANFGGVGAVVQGQYTVVATLPADSTYAGSIVSSRTVTIRK